MTYQPPPNDPNQPSGWQPGQPGQPGPGQPYQQGYYPNQQPPKQKRKKWPWVLLGIFLVFILIIGGCVAIIGSAAKSVDDESKRSVTVTYEITGDGPTASATYTTGNINTAQDTNVKVPWTKTVEITGLGKTTSLIASNGIDGDGSITCTIKEGDKVINTNTASGPAASASCSGSVN